MKALLLGVGMQGKAALFDWVKHGTFDEIVAADADIDGLATYIREMGFEKKVKARPVDVNDNASLDALLESRPNVVLDLLPAVFSEKVASKVISAGLNLVNTCFVRPGIETLDATARENGVALLPEFGVDPGIDLMLLGEVVSKLDDVTEIRSYGAGIPEPSLKNCNPIRYKATWTLEGVLGAYNREARQVNQGREEIVPADALFHPSNVHHVDIDGIGTLEAYPNSDATSLATHTNLSIEKLTHLGCYTMRWPGHAAFWKPLVELGLLRDEPVEIGGSQISKKAFLARALAPSVTLQPDERDMVIIRVEATGIRDSEQTKVAGQLIDYRDLQTGFTAMSRTVGFTAAIGATLVASGRIAKNGLLSPVRDVPFETMKNELKKRGIALTTS